MSGHRPAHRPNRQPNRHRRPKATQRPRLVAMTLTGSLSSGALLLGSAAPAMAADPVSQSEGRFLGGSVLGTDLATLLSVASAQAASAGIQDEMLNPLSVAALNAVDIPLGAINLLGANGVLTLGAVAQYALAEADGSSLAAAGAVTDAGAIGVGGVGGVPVSDASLDLSDLIPGGLAGVLGGVSLDVGALAARATQAAGSGGAQAGSYSIADLDLDVTSPAVAQVLATLRTTLAGLQSSVDGIADVLDTLTLGLAVVTGIPQLTDIVDALGPVTSGDGSLRVDLQSGTIEIDVAALVDAAGPDLNNLPADTELLPLIAATLTTQLLPTITTALTNLTGALTAALNGIGATVLGLPIDVGDLLSAVTPVLTSVTGVVNTAISSLDPVLDDTLAGALPDVVGLVANAQDSSAGRFTETALRVSVLPLAGPAATLDLASASVGPNGGPVIAAVPTSTGIDPDHGPEAGGTVVTITGTDFTSDATVSVDGGSAITPTAIDPGGTSLTYVAPPHAPGPVGVTVTTAGGTTAPLTYTYDPAPPVPTPVAPVALGIDPDHGPEAGGTVVTITGTGFTPDATVSVGGGAAITPTSVAPDGTSLTYVAPAHAPGPVDVTVTTPDGTTDPLTYTYDPSPAVAPVDNPPPDSTPDDSAPVDEADDSTPPALETTETALPRTGTEAEGVAALGLLSLLGGAGLLAGGRLHRSSGSARGRHRAVRGRHARR